MPRTYVDRGGTFTDVIVVEDDGTATLRKVRSDVAVTADLQRGALTYGTTVVTNALLERRGVPTLLLITEGFGDLPQIRAMARPELFDPDAVWPPSLATRVVEVPGRLSAGGVEVAPLALPPLDLVGIEAVAIVLLHGPANPAHEDAVAAAVRAVAPHVYVSVGHRLQPEPGYLARVETTLVDAALTPVLKTALEADGVPSDARLIRSDASLTSRDGLLACDAVLSGPAGGVLAVQAIARQLGAPGAVGLDMGGTSTDVVCVLDHLPRHPADKPVAGVFLRRPMLAMETIAAGGGSVLWHDGLMPRVGPTSAGASPGPQCYGAGGPPTITDAAVAAGLVDVAGFQPPLRPNAVDLPGPAQDFLDVAREAMAAAVQRLAGSWGVDPSALPLVSFGGAAGQHAAFVAERLGMREVVVHPFASALSAWGQTLAVEADEAVRSVAPGDDLPAVLTSVQASLPARPHVERTVVMGVEGTSSTLDVAWDPDAGARAAAFEAAHLQTFGFSPSGQAEVRSVRVRVSEDPPVSQGALPDPWGLGDRVIVGPCRLDGGGTSVVVPSGWSARRVDGLLRLGHEGASKGDSSAGAALAVWSSRLTSVAERAGEHLRRLARSVSVRDRRDFSCAVFDGRGRLIVNAPHVPVHLGAMGETVRDLLVAFPDAVDGSVWLSNDPAAGGSHLPDLTVVSALVIEGQRFFVASRAHHADVGGVTPGSMPPFAQRLEDEGVVIRRHGLVVDGQLVVPDALRVASRQPEVVAADLAAQVASNTLAARLLRQLGDGAELSRWMGELHEASAAAARAAILRVQPGEAEEDLDGVRLRASVAVIDGLLHIDLGGCGGPHPGNLNAPPGVVRAAVLYVLRLMLGDGVPLCDGALDAVRLIVPHASIVSPPEGAAIAGGNVETSQRLVDLLLAALGMRAASHGTMNNLTLGGDGWSLYETVGGGGGASATSRGASAQQVHMTNTMATDPEVLERRLPVRLWRMAVRRGSGGAGAHPGGDGVVRVIEVLEPATASLLAAWRPAGAPGMDGGGAGLPGQAFLLRDGVAVDWDGQTTPLAPGARVVLMTPGGGGFGPPREAVSFRRA